MPNHLLFKQQIALKVFSFAFWPILLYFNDCNIGNDKAALTFSSRRRQNLAQFTLNSF